MRVTIHENIKVNNNISIMLLPLLFARDALMKKGSSTNSIKNNTTISGPPMFNITPSYLLSLIKD